MQTSSESSRYISLVVATTPSPGGHWEEVREHLSSGDRLQRRSLLGSSPGRRQGVVKPSSEAQQSKL